MTNNEKKTSSHFVFELYLKIEFLNKNAFKRTYKKSNFQILFTAKSIKKLDERSKRRFFLSQVDKITIQNVMSEKWISVFQILKLRLGPGINNYQGNFLPFPDKQASELTNSLCDFVPDGKKESRLKNNGFA